MVVQTTEESKNIVYEEKNKQIQTEHTKFRKKTKNTCNPSKTTKRKLTIDAKEENKIQNFIHKNVFSDNIHKKVIENEPLMFSSCSLVKEKNYRIEVISEVREKEFRQNKQDINKLMKRLSQLSVKTTHKESWTDCPNLIDCENFLDRIKISLSMTDCDSSSSCSSIGYK